MAQQADTRFDLSTPVGCKAELTPGSRLYSIHVTEMVHLSAESQTVIHPSSEIGPGIDQPYVDLCQRVNHYTKPSRTLLIYFSFFLRTFFSHLSITGSVQLVCPNTSVTYMMHVLPPAEHLSVRACFETVTKAGTPSSHFSKEGDVQNISLSKIRVKRFTVSSASSYDDNIVF